MSFPAASQCLLIEEVLRDEKLKDIANTLTNAISHHYTNNRWSTTDEKPTRDDSVIFNDYPMKIQMRPKSLQLSSPSAPSIVSAIVKKMPTTPKSVTTTVSSTAPTIVTSTPKAQSTTQRQPLNSSPKQQRAQERGDPDGGCNMDDQSINYLANDSEMRVNLPAEDLLNVKKGWLMKQSTRTGEWTKHWFTLRGAALFYYRDPIAEERGVLDGVLDVNGLASVSEVPVARNYGFQLTTWDKRRIVLSTLSANTRNNWLNVLRTAAGLSSQTAASVKSATEKLTSATVATTLTSTSASVTAAIKKKVEDKPASDVKMTKEKDVHMETHGNGTDAVKGGVGKDVVDGPKPKQLLLNRESSSTLSNGGGSKVNTPLTSKSSIFSSDEEYRTASEGGRRDSVDWGSPLSPSPPILMSMKSIAGRTKDRIRSRSNSNSRLHKRSRSSPPSSRRSTVDSIGSDELPPAIQAVPEEMPVDNDMQQRLVTAETELMSLKDEAQQRETRTAELLSSLKQTELELAKQIHESQEAKDTLSRQLLESRAKAEEVVARLTTDLTATHVRYKELEDRLNRGIEENDALYKKIRDMESSSSSSSLSSLNRLKVKRVDSLSDLTTLSAIDPLSIDKDTLVDEYNELKSRFEKAVIEIRAMKKELKESQNQYDNLEIAHAALRQDLEQKESNDRCQIQMMAARIQDLTLKYSNSERQVRTMKQKLQKSERRRSLSLKGGRESLTVQKELEDKVAELESKIDWLESSNGSGAKAAKLNDDHASEQRAAQRASARLRHKSLDSSPSEAVQVLLRLNTLEKRVEKASTSKKTTHGTVSPAKSGARLSIAPEAPTSPSSKLSDHLMDRLRTLENVVITSKDRIEQGLQQLQCLKLTKSRRSVSPIADRKDTYRFVERCLTEAVKILRESCDDCLVNDGLVTGKLVMLPATSPIKMALTQLESQLCNKLNDLLKQRRVLRERNEFTPQKNIELLAERIAYESVCFGRLRDAISRAEDPTMFGERQTNAEAAETAQLMALLKAKLGGKCAIKPSGTVDILASVLARRLVLSSGRTGQLKIPEMSPINSNVMDDLLRQQNELHLITKRYKNNAMEMLACGLAAETLMISSNDAVQGAVQEAWRQAQEVVNAELVQSEIGHIMMRNASRFENSIKPSFGYTLTTPERVSFENFADAVQDALRKEMEVAIAQLTNLYEESVSKMKRGQWRLHLEQERKASEGRQLLSDFADIIAHKALVDARIAVLKGDYVAKDQPHDTTKDNGCTFSVDALQKYENLFAELATDLQISNPQDILAEADFNFMFKHFSAGHALDQSEIGAVAEQLQRLEQNVAMLQSSLMPNTSITTANFEATTLHQLSTKCAEIQKRVEPLIVSAQKMQGACDDCDKMQHTIQQLAEQHETELDDLRKIHEDNYDVLKRQFDEQLERTNALEDERQKILVQLDAERNLVLKHEAELRDVTEQLERKKFECMAKEKDNYALMETIEEGREKSVLMVQDSQQLLQKLQRKAEEFDALREERDVLHEKLEKERECVRKLEKQLEIVEQEQSQHIESLQETYKEQQMTALSDDDNECDNSFKQRYQAEIEQLRVSGFDTFFFHSISIIQTYFIFNLIILLID